MYLGKMLAVNVNVKVKNNMPERSHEEKIYLNSTGNIILDLDH